MFASVIGVSRGIFNVFVACVDRSTVDSIVAKLQAWIWAVRLLGASCSWGEWIAIVAVLIVYSLVVCRCRCTG